MEIIRILYQITLWHRCACAGIRCGFRCIPKPSEHRGNGCNLHGFHCNRSSAVPAVHGYILRGFRCMHLPLREGTASSCDLR